MNTRKIRCGVANKLLNVCKSAICKTKYLQVELIEQVFREGKDIDKILWERKILAGATIYFIT